MNGKMVIEFEPSVQDSDFDLVINPATMTVPYKGSDTRCRIWVKVSYHERRLSFVGVEGPLRYGHAMGGCGQCGINAAAVPTSGYTLGMLERLRQVWDQWHLNDARPFSPEMRAAGWHVKARQRVLGYSFLRATDAYRASRDAEVAAIAAAKAGMSFTPSLEQARALNVPAMTKVWVYPDEPVPATPPHMERQKYSTGPSRGRFVEPESKTLGWLRPSEHPDGLLGRKLQPDDPFGYGSMWWHEDVPVDVLQWLWSLPLPPPGLKPAWV